MPTATLNGIDIYYERSGAGERLLFINGSGATLTTAALLVSYLSRHFDVAAHDQRGLGATGVPPGPYAMADYAADAAALVEHLGWDRYRVIGLSFGGMVAQELAVTSPERIERLALLCTSPGGAGGSSYPLHTLAEMDPADRDAARLRIVDERFDAEWLATHDADRRMIEMRAEQDLVAKPESVLVGERLQLEARIGHDVYDRLDRIACPTLIASGRYDGIAPPANGEAIASQIAGAELRLFEGGHMFIAQDPTALPAIVDFLKAVD